MINKIQLIFLPNLLFLFGCNFFCITLFFNLIVFRTMSQKQLRRRERIGLVRLFLVQVKPVLVILFIAGKLYI
jgi:hypothetical protein